MSDWHRGIIGELAKGYRGVSYAAGQLRQFQSPETVTLLRSNNISSGRLNFEDVQIVPSRLVSEEQLLRPGDIAVCMSNGSKALVGKAAPFLGSEGERFTVGAFCSVFRPSDASAATFVSFVFQSREYRRNLDLALAGTAINNLRNADLEAFGCNIPPSDEQSKIAQILGTLDTAIHETEAIIAKLKAVKQGLLHDLLTRGIDANGELRPPQTEAPHLYKPSPLGWVPKAWEVKPISEVADVRSGATPSRDQANRYFAAHGIPWVKTLDLNEDFIGATNECVTEAALRETSCSLLPQGTVLVAMYGGWEQIGRTALLAVPAATNQAISALIFRSSGTVPEFILRSLQHGRPRWHTVAASTRKDPNITKADVLAFDVPLPPPDEQAEIVRRLRTCVERVELENGMLAKLRCQKSGLMDDLLTGRVRVTPLLAEAEPQAECA